MIPSFCTNYSKTSLFISANTCEKNIVSKECWNARHDDKVCFLPDYRYHIILMGGSKELLQKLDVFCCNCQHVDCLYTLLNNQLSGKNVVKSGQLFDNVPRAIHFNHQNRGIDRIPSIAKQKLLRKNYKNTCWAPSKSLTWRKLRDQCFQTQLNKLKSQTSNWN